MNSQVYYDPDIGDKIQKDLNAFVIEQKKLGLYPYKGLKR